MFGHLNKGRDVDPSVMPFPMPGGFAYGYLMGFKSTRYLGDFLYGMYTGIRIHVDVSGEACIYSRSRKTAD